MTVAQRKLESSYMKFIKTAQKFYRGYIQSLSMTYGNIPELERVARKVHFEGCFSWTCSCQLLRLIFVNTRPNETEAERSKGEPCKHTSVLSRDSHSFRRSVAVP